MSNGHTQIVMQLPKIMSKNRRLRTAKRLRAKGTPESVIKNRVFTIDPLARKV